MAVRPPARRPLAPSRAPSRVPSRASAAVAAAAWLKAVPVRGLRHRPRRRPRRPPYPWSRSSVHPHHCRRQHPRRAMLSCEVSQDGVNAPVAGGSTTHRRAVGIATVHCPTIVCSCVRMRSQHAGRIGSVPGDGPGGASLRRLSVGGRGRGEGDVLRRRALFGRAFAWHFSFNRRIVDSVSYMTREIEFENHWHSENRGAASVLPFSGRTDLARC